MAKLPRLMQQGPPQLVDPRRLAENRDDISGVLAIAELPRLAELLRDNSGSVQFELYFEKNEQDRVRIFGKFAAELIMECQRCLQAVEVNIAREISVVLISNENEAKSLSNDVEPSLMTGKNLSLPLFFEDELLLAIPLAPSHDSRDCHVAEQQQSGIKNDTHRPFEVLKDLKLNK